MSDEQKSVEENIPESDDNSADAVVDEVTQEEELNAEENSVEEAASEADDEVLVDDDAEVDDSDDDEPLVDDFDESDDDEPLVDDVEVDEAVDDDESLVDDIDDEEEPSEPPRPEGTEWYVIHSYSGYENKVMKNLHHRIDSMDMQNKIFQVVVPTEEEVELKDGQRRTIERRVFPGYILVEMILDEDSWYVVRNTPGVTGFVGSGTKPTPLRQDEVDKIIKRMDAEVPKIKVSFKVGQKVRIVEGPFEEFMGTVDEIDLERARVRVLVNFFGRETPIELDFLQVERT
jgi:transcriptional antiterminator NusG